MEKYSGNAICEYIRRKGLDLYYCSAKNNWMLIYGNIDSIPKIMVFVISVKDINCVFSDTEKQEMHKALSIARYLGLPFMVVGTKEKNEFVKFWKEGEKKWEIINYDKLRDIYQEYGVVQQGSAKKRVNQYVSSSYHIWQREALGPITVSDLDLIKYDKDRVQEIIELKRSKIALDQWKPFEKDYPNFALLINAIVLSGKNIPFTLYYNLLKDGQKGNREEDITEIIKFDFIIPKSMISRDEVQYCFKGCYKLEQLLELNTNA